jgi:acetylornithine deacetylase
MERARQSDLHFKAMTHPINFNPGIIKGGDWASSVPAWCDVDCRIAILPGWSVADRQPRSAPVSRRRRATIVFSPTIRPRWNGPAFVEGYELKDSPNRKPHSARPSMQSTAARCRTCIHRSPTRALWAELQHPKPGGASGAAMHRFNE